MRRERVDKDLSAHQHAKEYRRDENSERVIAPEQSHRYPPKTPFGRESVIVIMAVAEHLADRDHSGESARDRHGKHDLLSWVDAAVFGRRCVLARRAKLVTPLRLPQKNPN